MRRQNAGVFGLSRVEAEAQHGQGLRGVGATPELTRNFTFSHESRDTPQRLESFQYLRI